jgi:hypothetical protein
MNKCVVFISESLGNPVEIARTLQLLKPDALPARQAPEDELEDHELGIANARGWHILFMSPNQFLTGAVHSPLMRLSYGGRIFFWLAQGKSGLWFELHENGVVKRSWLYGDGIVEASLGRPLPQEPYGKFPDEADPDGHFDEWDVIELGVLTTGIMMGDLFSLPCAAYRL